MRRIVSVWEIIWLLLFGQKQRLGENWENNSVLAESRAFNSRVWTDNFDFLLTLSGVQVLVSLPLCKH